MKAETYKVSAGSETEKQFTWTLGNGGAGWTTAGEFWCVRLPLLAGAMRIRRS